MPKPPHEVDGKPQRDFGRGTRMQISTSPSSNGNLFDEDYLSTFQRRSCCGISIANAKCIYETKSHPVISLLISPHHTALRVGGRFPDSRTPNGSDWHSREV
jgi:hypothetical protein